MASSSDVSHAAAHAGHGHAPKAHYKEYFVIFALLGVLTLLEIGAAYLPITQVLKVSALILLAVAKAALVGLYYMHLKSETNILKLTVAIPMSLPALYAFVLIGEAAWRLVRGEAVMGAAP